MTFEARAAYIEWQRKLADVRREYSAAALNRAIGAVCGVAKHLDELDTERELPRVIKLAAQFYAEELAAAQAKAAAVRSAKARNAANARWSRGIKVKKRGWRFTDRAPA